MQTTQHHRIYLQQLGYDCIPITPSTKACNVDGWSTGSTWGMWQGREDHDLGIRMGSVVKRNGKRYTVAVLDGDDKNIPGSSDRLRSILAGLGIGEGDTPEVQTRNDGRHWYVLLRNAPKDDSAKHFKQGIAGELRYGRGALVVAPPSPGYKRIAGRWDDLAVVNYADIAPLLEPAPEPQERPQLGNGAGPDAILSWALQDVSQGNRNDTGFSLSCQLRDNGHDHATAESIMLEYQKHVEQGQHAYTCREALATARSAYKRPARNPWNGSGNNTTAHNWLEDAGTFTGRTAETDRDVLAAHLHHYRAARHKGLPTYHASSRDLAERAGITHRTAARATARLIEQGWLGVAKPAKGVLAAKYQPTTKTIEKGSANLPTMFTQVNLEEAGKERTTTTSNATQSSKMQDHSDLWRFGGLGKSARRVYRLVASGLDNVTDLTAAAGHVRTTIARALAKLEKHGLVVFDGSNWHVLAFDAWHDLADELGIAGYSERQQEKHDRERMNFRALVANFGLGRWAKLTLAQLHDLKDAAETLLDYGKTVVATLTSQNVKLPHLCYNNTSMVQVKNYLDPSPFQENLNHEPT